MRKKVEYKEFVFRSIYSKDKEEMIILGWNVVDYELIEKSTFIIGWMYFVKGWIIYEMK